MVVVHYCTLTLNDMGLSLNFHKGTLSRTIARLAWQELKQQRKPVGLLERGEGRIGTSYKGPYVEAPPEVVPFSGSRYISLKGPGEICQVCQRTYRASKCILWL